MVYYACFVAYASTCIQKIPEPFRMPHQEGRNVYVSMRKHNSVEFTINTCNTCLHKEEGLSNQAQGVHMFYSMKCSPLRDLSYSNKDSHSLELGHLTMHKCAISSWLAFILNEWI